MGAIVAIRRCFDYDVAEVEEHIAWLYEEGNGPDPSGKKVLLKPNILSDDDPGKAMTTHPVVVEAVIKYLQSRGATVFVGDSPTIDTIWFTGEKCGIRQVTERCGATWVRFNNSFITRNVGKANIKITALVAEADLIISLPKLKNHELMIFSGAMKNIFGFIPGFNKALQHVNYPDRNHLARFFIDLEEAVRPHFHIMDGIVGMEGPGPGNGYPKKMNVLLASSNPLAMDIIASRIAGYDHADIPTIRAGLERGELLKNADDIIIKGPDPSTIVIKDFKRIYKGGEAGIILKALRKKIPFIRRLDKRPVFNHALCISCSRCIDICPLKCLSFHEKKTNHILINDRPCIRCYCCSEVCSEGAVLVIRKFWGK